MDSSLIFTTCSTCTAPDRSRAISYSEPARSSRCDATRAWKRKPAVSWPVINPTASMMMNVSRYCTSLTANEKRGGTKKKSKAPTLNIAASAAGPRPKRTATNTTVKMNTATMLERSKCAANGNDASVTPMQASAAHR